MGIFEKQALLFEGRDRLLYQRYQEILRSNGVRFKAYETEDRLAGGCCGLNSPTWPGGLAARRTYSLFVPARLLEEAKALLSAHKPDDAAGGRPPEG